MISGGILKKSGMAVLEWLVRLLNLSFDMGLYYMYWRGACIVSLYKGKCDKYQCSNSSSYIVTRVACRFGKGL